MIRGGRVVRHSHRVGLVQQTVARNPTHVRDVEAREMDGIVQAMRDAAGALKRDGRGAGGRRYRSHLIVDRILQPENRAACTFMHAVFSLVARPNLQRLALEIDAFEALRIRGET
eukprot:4113155-Pleurochrysis_carterae.AAC.2